MKLFLGDCLCELARLEDNSIDSIVTDPPYGLSFMGKKWDYDVPSTEIWKDCLRVLKPGGHLLAFFGTRTYHRGVVKIEDAGFEIRDQIMWIYGSGFPKSHNIDKAIDKLAGVEREIVGRNKNHRQLLGSTTHGDEFQPHTGDGSITKPATPEAKQWQGWGTALKPANEPIVLARKPLEKGLTIAENVLKWGTGAINVDGTRIGVEQRLSKTMKSGTGQTYGKYDEWNGEYKQVQGRWPANIIFDEEAAQVLGEPSRFFYVAKASKSERNKGLEGMPEKKGSTAFTGEGGGVMLTGSGNPRSTHQSNHHPTVKPIKLMEYLCKLITPPNGTILDPFMGSGSTGVAAKGLGFKFVGIERDEQYFEIAKRRIDYKEAA